MARCSHARTGPGGADELALAAAGTSALRHRQEAAVRTLAGSADWRAVQRLLTAERLLGLLGTRLLELAPESVPEWFRDAVEESVVRERRRSELLETIQLDLCTRLERAGIAALPLKGPRLARRIHGDPGLRPCNDIDLLVDPLRLGDAVDVALAMGYRRPADPAVVDGLPQLHLALPGDSAWLPPLELHWRVHWYERSFSSRMLARSGLDREGVRRARPEDELTSLLLFMARDGFAGLRLAVDAAAWWDAHRGALSVHALDPMLEEHRGLRPPVLSALQVAERVTGVPAGALASGRFRPSRRARAAARLAGFDRAHNEADHAAGLTLVDLLLTPRGGLRAFVRRHLLPPGAAIAATYGLEGSGRLRRAVRRLLHGRAVTADYLPRWASRLWRLRRGPAIGSPPERPRLLLAVHSAQRGGAERMALLAAAHLSTRYRLDLSVGDGPLAEPFAEHGERLPPAPLLPLWGGSPLRWALQTGRTLLAAVRLARTIRSRGVDLVLTNSTVLLAPVLGARLAGIPAVVHARDVPDSRAAPLVFAVHALLADTIIAVNERLAARFPRRLGAKVVTIRDGVPVDAPAESNGEADAGRSLRLCVAGGIDPRKGQDLAVEALAALGDAGVDAVLELVGRELDTAFADRVRERAHRLGVEDRVLFSGEKDDIDGALRSADVVLLPSRSEWTPLVAMEALARCRLVVATDVGAVSDIVVDGETGMLTPPDDPRALADAVAGLVRAPAAARAIAERGRAHIVDEFDLERSLAGLEREVARALSGGRS